MPGKRDFNFVVEGDRPGALAWTLLVIGAIAFAIVADGFGAAGSDNEQLVRQVERLQRRAKSVVTTGRRSEREQKSVAVARQEGPPFPWDSALTEVELIADRNVALLSMNTDASARRTRLTGESRKIDDALSLASRLRESPLVREAFLVSHEARRDGPVPAITFTLQVDWRLE